MPKVTGETPLRNSAEGGLPALYFQLANVFRRRIEDGQWPVEAQIPTLEELVADFGAARATVRQALSIIEREGLVARHRGRGTFVLKRPAKKSLQRIDTNWFSMIGTAADKRELLESKLSEEPPRASHDGGILASRYQYFVRRYWMEGKPYVIRFGYLDSRIWEKLTPGQIKDAPMVSTLTKISEVPIDRCEQTITISSADFEIARMLSIPLNAPIAIVERSVFDSRNVLVFENRGYYRGDLVKINMTLKETPGTVSPGK
jgi:GntR family transcriptional regulator